MDRARDRELGKFHRICGEDIWLSEGCTVAERVKSCDNGMVFTEQPIPVGTAFQIELLQRGSADYAGSLALGFTTKCPGDKILVPPPTHSSLGQSIGCIVNEKGELHYFVDGKDQGLACTGLPIDKPLWGFVDVYGLTEKIKSAFYIPPRQQCSNCLQLEQQESEEEEAEIEFEEDQEEAVRQEWEEDQEEAERQREWEDEQEEAARQQEWEEEEAEREWEEEQEEAERQEWEDEQEEAEREWEEEAERQEWEDEQEEAERQREWEEEAERQEWEDEQEEAERQEWEDEQEEAERQREWEEEAERQEWEDEQEEAERQREWEEEAERQEWEDEQEEAERQREWEDEQEEAARQQEWEEEEQEEAAGQQEMEEEEEAQGEQELKFNLQQRLEEEGAQREEEAVARQQEIQELQQRLEEAAQEIHQQREEATAREQVLQQRLEEAQQLHQQREETAAREQDLQQRLEEAQQLHQQREETAEREQGSLQLELQLLQQRLDTATAELQRLRSSQHVTVQAWMVPRGDIEIMDEIDRGAWGVVARGRFQSQVIAVKLPHPAICNEHTIERLRREVKIMAQVHHPNLLRFIAAVFDDLMPPLIVMELLDVNLRTAYQNRRVGDNSKIPIFRDVAYALHYLHEHREPIIHRDVSAPNVLLEELPNQMWRAKVSDFGSANVARVAQTMGEGAIIYAAPETIPQAYDRNATPPPQTSKIDVYSYGVLLCEVITCQLPDPAQYQSMLRQLQSQWYELIIHCTERNPEDRPTMSQVLNRLNQLPQSTLSSQQRT